MTQIPEVGSEWIRGGKTAKVIFADDRSVILENDDGSRWHFAPKSFADHFKPAARTVTHRRWVNLYADGYVGQWFTTESEAKSCSNRDIVETRLIEWTVEE